MKPELEAKVREILPQAEREARKIYHTAPHALDLDELVALANMGLAQAAARWPEYCKAHGYDENALHYFAAYCLRRIRGSMRDAMRSEDWVTRSVRSDAKALREAGQDQGLDERQLAEKTGMPVAKIRRTMAAMSRKPVSMDAEPVDIAEENRDVEGQAIVNSITAAQLAAIRRLHIEAQFTVALHYYAGMDFKQIAELLEVSESRISALHEQAVREVHEAMIHQVREA